MQTEAAAHEKIHHNKKIDTIEINMIFWEKNQ